MVRPSDRTNKYKKSSVHTGRNGVHCTMFLLGSEQKNAIEFGRPTSAIMGSPTAQHAEPKWWNANESRLVTHLQGDKANIQKVEFEVSADLCESCNPMFAKKLRKVFGGREWNFPIYVFIIREKLAYHFDGVSLVVEPWG